MYPSAKARELAILLRISRELDVCGDLTATVDNPSELIAWASVLVDPKVLAWRAQDSGSRFVQVGADHHRAPVRGHLTAVLSCDQHSEFWDALALANLEAGRTRKLSVKDLAVAWEAMPIGPPDSPPTPAPPPTSDDSQPTRTSRRPDAADSAEPTDDRATSEHDRPRADTRLQAETKEAS